jgi:c-di-GMP-binding flagellar brake protein YcgR
MISLSPTIFTWLSNLVWPTMSFAFAYIPTYGCAEGIMEKSDHTNRRKSPRRKPRVSVKVECRKGSFGLGANLASTTLDLSDTGVRLVVTQAVEVMAEMEIIIAGYGMNKPLKRLANVRWVVKLEDGRYCIGAEFQKRLVYRDWQNLASPS